MTEPSADFALSVTAKGVLRISPRLRETYLAPSTDGSDALIQSAGYRVHVWLWSDREDIRIDLPREAFLAGDGYDRRVREWGVNVNRYIGDGGIVIDRDGRKPTVPATVHVVGGEA